METKSCIGNSVLISKKDFEASRSTSALTEAERLTENYINSEVMQGNDEEQAHEGDKVSQFSCFQLLFLCFSNPIFYLY
jgi:hypothetical protein